MGYDGGLDIVDWIVIIVAVLFLLALLICVIIMAPNEEELKNCLEEIAKDECRDREMKYKSTFTSFGYGFHCKEDLRKQRLEVFSFLDSEIKDCKQEAKND